MSRILTSILKILLKGGTICTDKTFPPLLSKNCSNFVFNPMPVLSSIGMPRTCKVCYFNQSLASCLAFVDESLKDSLASLRVFYTL